MTNEKHKRNTDLKLGKLISSELLPGQDEPDDVLGEEGEAAEVQHFIPMFIHKLQHLQTHTTKLQPFGGNFSW